MATATTELVKSEADQIAKLREYVNGWADTNKHPRGTQWSVPK